MSYTNIDDPSAYFQTKTYSGNSVDDTAITNDGNSNLQPDFVWFKRRNSATNHILQDSNRGVTKNLESDNTAAEYTAASRIKSFDTDGVTLGTSAGVNGSGYTYVAWQWKANGGTTASNTNGSVTSTVQVNQDAGFSIVTWTTGVGSGNHSVGHGLGVKPAMFITKSRGSTSSWTLWHQGMAGDTSYIKLDTTAAEQTFSDIWGDGITSSVFGYNYPATVYANQPYIAYCFAEKQGYSKFGKYVGNGSNTNGSFIYTGFRPAMIIAKRTDASAHNWFIWDTKRAPSNLVQAVLYPNATSAESSLFEIDILSNGFKHYNNYGSTNASGGTYIYMAFAESSFVTSGGIPTTAR